MNNPKEMPPVPEGYRLLTIKTVTNPPQDESRYYIEFEEMQIIPKFVFYIMKKHFDRMPTEGEYVFIKGKKGNLDGQLWGFDGIEDIKLAE